MKLRRWLESYWGLDYDRLSDGKFDSANYFQSRDYEFQSPATVIEMMVATKMVDSKTEAKRAIKSGAVRVGLGDEWTPFGDCKKLTADRLLEPNDLVRMGRKAFRMVPKRPTFKEEVIYTLRNILPT